MSAVAEMLLPQEVLSPSDLELAELIELGEPDLQALTETRVHYLGNIVLSGEPEHPVIRVHCGPEGTIHRGGTKFKYYDNADTWRQDGIDHGKAMRDKIGGIDETAYSGGKTIANIDPRPAHLSPNAQHMRLVTALDQLAGLVVDADLADPSKDGTAGDEGTNGEIGISYLGGLRKRGVPHAEACVTGKPDMHIRPAATGRGAVISRRTSMRERGESKATVAIQGAGFAGAYYAAEAYQPHDSVDEDVSILPVALGDIDPRTKKPVTLQAMSAVGLPITRSMVDGILLDPTDRHVQATGGDKLAALAQKLEDAGASVQIVDQDVLTFDPDNRWQNTYLVPAATSNVLRPDNVGSVVIKDWDEVGNHTVNDQLMPRLQSLGIRFAPGELRNVGSVKVSIEENRRDLSQIAAAEAGGLYLPASDEEYETRLRNTMVSATRQAHLVSSEYGVDLRAANKLVALGNYALANNMHISDTMHAMLTI